MHALWNALVKGGLDSLATMTLICAVASIVSILALIFLLPLPSRESWQLLAISLVAHLGYKVCLLLAYRYGELGQVYPIARGGAPLVLLVLSLLVLPLLPLPHAQLLPANLSSLQILAVLLIALSVISLAFIGKDKGKNKGKNRGGYKIATRGVLFACATACFIAIYSMLDAMGARVAQNPIAYVAALMALDFFPIAVVFLYCNYRFADKSTGLTSTSLISSWRRLARGWRQGVCGGVLSLAAYTIVVYAMTRVAVAPVVALRETSIVFAALIGWLFLQERHAVWRIIPSVLIAIAVVMLKIYG